MPECKQCGSHLTERYVAIFGNRDDEVENCLHCKDGSRINERETSGMDTDQ